MTKQELVELLKGKEGASALYHALQLRNTNGLNFEERVDLDIQVELALRASAKAEVSYKDALVRYANEQKTDEGVPW